MEGKESYYVMNQAAYKLIMDFVKSCPYERANPYVKILESLPIADITEKEQEPCKNTMSNQEDPKEKVEQQP